MSINSILTFIKPKENKFFPMIKAIGDNLTEASLVFANLVAAVEPSKANAYRTKMKELEVNGDSLLNKLLSELNNTFITPFDREDIHTLCESLDNVLDSLNTLSKRIYLYEPRSMQKHLEQSSRIICDCCASLQVITNNLSSLQSHPAVLLEECKKLHTLEQEGDDLYDATTVRIFHEEKDAVEVIKDKGILGHVESAIDEAYTASKLVKNMIVKYA